MYATLVITEIAENFGKGIAQVWRPRGGNAVFVGVSREREEVNVKSYEKSLQNDDRIKETIHSVSVLPQIVMNLVGVSIGQQMDWKQEREVYNHLETLDKLEQCGEDYWSLMKKSHEVEPNGNVQIHSKERG